MSILNQIKDAIARTSQRALGLDGIRFNLQVALERLERVYQIESSLERLEARTGTLDSRTASLDSRMATLESRTAGTNDQIQNLKNFLTWYSNRVEPWFWSGNFSLSEPEEELAGLLFNFLPGRLLINLDTKDTSFTKAATAIGYEVLAVAPPNTIGSLAASKALPAPVDFLNIPSEKFDLDLANSLNWMKPAVVQTGFNQTGFNSDGSRAIGDRTSRPLPLALTEITSEMRRREYYWSIVIFRTEAEGFIRMATNLASIPSPAWGRLLFFHDHQLFLKAFHWCKTTLPRFRAAPLAKSPASEDSAPPVGSAS